MAAALENLAYYERMGFLEEVRSKSAKLTGAATACFSGPSKISAVRGLRRDWD